MTRQHLAIILAIAGFILLLIILYVISTFRVVGQLKETEPLDGASQVFTDLPIRLEFEAPVASQLLSLTLRPTAEVNRPSSGKVKSVVFELAQPLSKLTEYEAVATVRGRLILPDGQKTRRLTWRFTTGKLASNETPSGEESDEQTGDPFLDQLPYFDPERRFDISRGDEQGIITITTLGIYNRPEQYEEFLRQTKAYREAALQWIRDQGKDPAKLNLRFEPTDEDLQSL